MLQSSLQPGADRSAAGVGVRPPLRLACTGFVSESAGSVATANALLLRSLLDAGVQIDFFSKPSFVDPRPAVQNRPGFTFFPVINRWYDGLRRRAQTIPVASALTARLDAASYNRLLVQRMRQEHLRRRYDAVLWMGDYAHGTIHGVPSISFAQGAPGTDARSILRRRREIRRLAGTRAWLKWEALARLRLSAPGLPAFCFSDHFIVGSSTSRDRLTGTYRISPGNISLLPYPIDLELFHPGEPAPAPAGTASPAALRVLWLGRIVPRKRLDLFLAGAEQAIRLGLNLKLTIVGGLGMVNGYDRLIHAFPYPERLQWLESIPRSEVPTLLRSHDVLAQPSEEENFGSSVAEAQACGLPVLVGATNGNSDYLCPRDLRLADDRPETFAMALHELASRTVEGRGGTPEESRRWAERVFSLQTITQRLIEIIRRVVTRQSSLSCVSG